MAKGWELAKSGGRVAGRLAPASYPNWANTRPKVERIDSNARFERRWAEAG